MPLTVFARRQRDTHRTATLENIREFMLSVSGDPFTLYEVVAGGPYHFRLNFLRAFQGLAVDINVADQVFKFFCDQVVKRHPNMPAADAASHQLDILEVKSPPTQEEIDRSWVHEVFSSEEGRRAAYLDGAGMAGQDHKVIIRN